MHRMFFSSLYFFLIILLNDAHAQTKPNIIFITLDDQNDFTEGFDGSMQTQTPNIKRLEEIGTTFINAYCGAPQCGPSRMTMITGKDCKYTQVYNNPDYRCKTFRENFKPSLGNEEVFTIPQYLKDSAGYFTYHLNKVMHCYENRIEFDSLTSDICSKQLSWNRIFIYDDSSFIDEAGHSNLGGTNQLRWSILDNSLEDVMEDHVLIDSAIAFIQAYAIDQSIACDKPIFLGLGFRKPHAPWFTPEKYYDSNIQMDFYQVPFDKPYNDPKNAFPYNGLIMSPQPETPYLDFLQLPYKGVAYSLADLSNENGFNPYVDSLDPFPTVYENISDEQRKEILYESIRANTIYAYLASIKFVDAQIGRLLDALEANPEVYQNTIIIVFGDHGYSLGEKKHWAKGALWETDIRIPLVIADLRNPSKQISKSFVSMTDLFPTICDFVEGNYPKFSDGSPYFDGKSFYPSFLDTTLQIERPVLTSYIEKKSTEEGGCFPHYSMRNERFHYLKYQTNNADGGIDCDFSKSEIQEELYEIGIEKQTDPYEWNNLAFQDDYKSVIEYLQQFLPDSNLYMQNTIKVKMKNNTLPCFLDASDTIFGEIEMFDKEGIQILEFPESYSYKWTNNITNTTFSTETCTLPISILLAENPSLVRCNLYLQVYDSLNHLIAFDMKYFYVNEENEPSINFTLGAQGFSIVCIQNYEIDGSYNESWWDFGDGNILYVDFPGPYTYQQEGTYTITNYVQYGNDDCIKTFSQDVQVISGTLEIIPLYIYPNPAQTNIQVLLPSDSGEGVLNIYNALGQFMATYSIDYAGCLQQIELDISAFPRGAFLITFSGSQKNLYGKFIIDR